MEYGYLYIISNDNCFHKKVNFGHLEVIREFVDINQLGYSFKDEDYQEAPCILASDGYLVVKTVDNANVLICYLPEYVSDYQSMWVFEHSDLFRNFSIVAGYLIKKVDDSYITEKLHGMNEIMHQINRNNILYHRMNLGVKSGMKK